MKVFLLPRDLFSNHFQFSKAFIPRQEERDTCINSNNAVYLKNVAVKINSKI